MFQGNFKLLCILALLAGFHSAKAEEVCTSSLKASDPEQAELIEDLKRLMRSNNLDGHTMALENGLSLQLKDAESIQVTAVRLPKPALLQIGLEFGVITKSEIANSEYKDVALQHNIINVGDVAEATSSNIVESALNSAGNVVFNEKIKQLENQVQLQFNASFCRKGSEYVVNLAGLGLAGGQNGSFPITPSATGFELGSGKLGNFDIPGGSYVAH